VKQTKLILLAALVFAPVITRAVTVITSLPYRITASGEYELQDNLTANGTDGIDVEASNVSINLAGYTLTQGQTGRTGTGIWVTPNHTNVSIQNGTITGFGFGVTFDEFGSGHVLKNVQLLGSPHIGVYVIGNSNCRIENCSILGTVGNYAGICLASCNNVLVKNNQISEPDYGGIVVSGSGLPNALIGNYEANCLYGLYLDSVSKYQGNISTNCSVPVSGGIAVGKENG
jgi:parallel beta-helix repeat protein